MIMLSVRLSSVFNRYLDTSVLGIESEPLPGTASRKNVGDRVAPALGMNKSWAINKESETVIHPVDNLRTKRTVAVSGRALFDSIRVINRWKSDGCASDSKKLNVSIQTT